MSIIHSDEMILLLLFCFGSFDLISSVPNVCATHFLVQLKCATFRGATLGAMAHEHTLTAEHETGEEVDGTNHTNDINCIIPK